MTDPGEIKLEIISQATIYGIRISELAFLKWEETFGSIEISEIYLVIIDTWHEKQQGV